jgi:hypothetical protein
MPVLEALIVGHRPGPEFLVLDEELELREPRADVDLVAERAGANG